MNDFKFLKYHKMIQREITPNCYYADIWDSETGLWINRYWIFTNNNTLLDGTEITYYTLQVEEMTQGWRFQLTYTFRWIKDLEYTKEIAENYKKFKITKKNEDHFYMANEMRW